jgi:hypothetical protein
VIDKQNLRDGFLNRELLRRNILFEKQVHTTWNSSIPRKRAGRKEKKVRRRIGKEN